MYLYTYICSFQRIFNFLITSSYKFRVEIFLSVSFLCEAYFTFIVIFQIALYEGNSNFLCFSVIRGPTLYLDCSCVSNARCRNGTRRSMLRTIILLPFILFLMFQFNQFPDNTCYLLRAVERSAQSPPYHSVSTILRLLF